LVLKVENEKSEKSCRFFMANAVIPANAGIQKNGHGLWIGSLPYTFWRAREMELST